MQEMCSALWPYNYLAMIVFSLANTLKQGSACFDKSQQSAAITKSRMALALLKAHYPNYNLDNIVSTLVNGDGSWIEPKKYLSKVHRHARLVAKYCDLREYIRADHVYEHCSSQY